MSATQHYKIDQSPEAVWALLENPERYLDEVMGSPPTSLSGHWPYAGSAARHEVRVGPFRGGARTTTRQADAPYLLRLEVCAGLLGTLGLDLEMQPWGDGTFVTVREYQLMPAVHPFAQALPLILLLGERHRRALLHLEGAWQAER